MEDKILEILSEALGLEKDNIDIDADILEDLGANSLEAADMLISLEDEIGFEIPDADAVELRTVRAISEYIENKKAE